MILFVAINLETVIELNFIQKQLKNKLENLVKHVDTLTENYNEWDV